MSSKIILPLVKNFKPANTTLKMYPEDTPIFDRNSVSLELPDKLFTNTFSTATNASKILGTLIRNSARRFSYFAVFFKPLFGDALVIKDTAEMDVVNMNSTTMISEITSDDDFVFTTEAPEISTLDDSLMETTMKALISNEI